MFQQTYPFIGAGIFINMAVCPYCKKKVTGKTICKEDISGRGLLPTIEARLYSCPHCKTVLGIFA